MSQTIEGHARGPVAGNTHQNLAGTDRDVAAATIQLQTGEELTTEQIAEGTARNGITDVIVSSTPVIKLNPAFVEAVKANIAPPSILDAAADEADPLDEENTFDVSRAEFNELQEAFIRLVERINKYNQGASHKI